MQAYHTEDESYLGRDQQKYTILKFAFQLLADARVTRLESNKNPLSGFQYTARLLNEKHQELNDLHASMTMPISVIDHSYDLMVPGSGLSSGEDDELETTFDMRQAHSILYDKKVEINEHFGSLKDLTGSASQVLGAMGVARSQLYGISDIIGTIREAIDEAQSPDVIPQVVNIKEDLTTTLEYVVSAIESIESDFNGTINTFSEISEDIKMFQRIYDEYYMSQGISVALILVGILIAFKFISVIYRVLALCNGEVSFIKNYLQFRRSLRARAIPEGGE